MRFGIHLDALRVLREARVSLHPTRLCQVDIPKVDDGVYVRLVLHRQLERAVPVEESQVGLYGPEHETSLQ